MSHTDRHPRAGGYALLILLGAAAGWLAGYELRGGTEGGEHPAPVRILATSVRGGVALPPWAIRILGASAPREAAVAALRPLLPGLETSPRFRVLPGGDEETAPSALALEVRHPDPATALAVARWLAGSLRDEIAAAARARSGRPAPSRRRAAPAEPVPADLQIELAERRDAVEDLRRERGDLLAQQTRLWGLLSQARGRLQSIRKGLGAIPPLAAVRKKIVEDPALVQTLEDLPPGADERLLSLEIEEEVPNPLYARLSGLEAEALAQGTGYQTRLDEIPDELHNVERELASARRDALDLERETGAAREPSEPPAPAGGAGTVAGDREPPPVRILDPALPPPAPPPDLEAPLRRTALGALAGALAGWIAALLLGLTGRAGRD